MHPEHSIMEIPILAAAKAQRQRGHGSVLVALLMEMACRLRTRRAKHAAASCLLWASCYYGYYGYYGYNRYYRYTVTTVVDLLLRSCPPP